MTTLQMLDWFDILQDKFGSPYFSTDQKLLFLNNAQMEYLNNLFPDNEGGMINIEKDINVEQNAYSLIFELPELNMSNTGSITFVDLDSNLQTLTGDPNALVFDTLSVEFRKGLKRYPAKFLRHNDKAEFETNYFKKPSIDSPRLLLQNNSYQFRPLDVSAKIIFTVVKEPIKLSVSPPVNSDFPNQAHNEIVAYGLQFAGIASRDEVLTAMNLIQLPQTK